MSASSMSNQADPISVVIAQLQELHSELRLEVANRDDKSLNWTPCPGANSVATIVTHTLGCREEAKRSRWRTGAHRRQPNELRGEFGPTP